MTRLTHQKGIHLIKHAAWRTLGRGGQFVLLGSAPDPRVQVGEGCSYPPAAFFRQENLTLQMSLD